MHYQDPGQRPQVKLLCGLLMFLTVRAVPEEGVTNKEMNDYFKRKTSSLPLKDASIAQYSPCLTEGILAVEYAGEHSSSEVSKLQLAFTL